MNKLEPLSKSAYSHTIEYLQNMYKNQSQYVITVNKKTTKQS